MFAPLAFRVITAAAQLIALLLFMGMWVLVPDALHAMIGGAL